MANSLTDWLATKVLSSWESFDSAFETDQDKQSLLDDVAYLKGAKVQIIRFFAPQSVIEAEKELQSGEHDEEMRDLGESDVDLWACVSDRQHHVHVRFSHHCVNRFNK